MAFIEQTEVTDIVKADILEDIIDFDTNAWDDAVQWAQDQAAGYINERYDDTYEYQQTGDDRNKWLMGIIKDLALYRLHLRINPRAVPELRLEQCKMAMKNLTQVQNGTFSPAGLKKRTDDIGGGESDRRYSTGTSGTNPNNW